MTVAVTVPEFHRIPCYWATHHEFTHTVADEKRRFRTPQGNEFLKKTVPKKIFLSTVITGGGSRTHMSLLTMDFESIVSAIPPLRRRLSSGF